MDYEKIYEESQDLDAPLQSVEDGLPVRYSSAVQMYEAVYREAEENQADDTAGQETTQPIADQANIQKPINKATTNPEQSNQIRSGDPVAELIQYLTKSKKAYSFNFDNDIPELYANSYAGKILDGNTYKQLKKSCIKFCRSYQGKIVINQSSSENINKSIVIAREGIDEFKGKIWEYKKQNADRPFIIMILPILLKKATFNNVEANKKPEEKTYLKQVDIFEVKCKINNNIYNLEIKTEEHQTGSHAGQNRFHIIKIKTAAAR
jgi:hypothetical protein